MKIKILVMSLGLISLLLVVLSCKKTKGRFEDDRDGLAKNLQIAIKQLSTEPVSNPRATIWQYTYHNQTVYFIPVHSCCDMLSELYDSNFDLLCSPDGGFGGGGDGRCTDFYSARTDEKLIWEDKR